MALNTNITPSINNVFSYGWGDNSNQIERLNNRSSKSNRNLINTAINTYGAYSNWEDWQNRKADKKEYAANEAEATNLLNQNNDYQKQIDELYEPLNEVEPEVEPEATKKDVMTDEEYDKHLRNLLTQQNYKYKKTASGALNDYDATIDPDKIYLYTADGKEIVGSTLDLLKALDGQNEGRGLYNHGN